MCLVTLCCDGVTFYDDAHTNSPLRPYYQYYQYYPYSVLRFSYKSDLFIIIITKLTHTIFFSCHCYHYTHIPNLHLYYPYYLNHNSNLFFHLRYFPSAIITTIASDNFEHLLSFFICSSSLPFILSTFLSSFLSSGSGLLEFEEFAELAAKFLMEEDEEALKKELKEAFRFYDKECKYGRDCRSWLA